MKYRVLLTDRAANQLDVAYAWYQDHAAHAVTRWYRGLRDAIRGLSEQPDRFPLARESETFPYPLREMLYGGGITHFEICCRTHSRNDLSRLFSST